MSRSPRIFQPTWQQLAYLRVLMEGSGGSAELAKRNGVTPAAATHSLRSLERHGHVSGDTRSWNITATGRAAVELADPGPSRAVFLELLGE